MRRWIVFVVITLASFVLFHMATLHFIPSTIMSAVQTRMAERGIPINQWNASPRMTPQTQTIVRPSPDLSYAICRFNLREGAVLISAPGWDGYGSLSVFDARTNNVLVTNLDGQSAGVLLYHPTKPPKQEGRYYVRTDEEAVAFSGEGVALIRRVAPTKAKHNEAAQLVDQSICSAVNWAP
ncbi:MAG: DUF1254 domain-containing protein [Pseudomonadota bacterium]